MDTLFLVCAILGGTFMVCQLLAGLFGIGGDHGDHGGGLHGGGDHGSGEHHDQASGNWFFGLLTVRTVTAALTFFGLGGLCAFYYGANELSALGVAVGSGMAALYSVGLMMQSLTKLRSDGTAKIARAVGLPATVYLRIPSDRTGTGKVQVSLQNRTVEYLAVTNGPELATGATVTVVAVVNSDTVEVQGF